MNACSTFLFHEILEGKNANHSSDHLMFMDELLGPNLFVVGRVGLFYF